MAFVLIGAFESFRWAVHQWDSGRASSHHGPGLRSQAPKCSPLRHPGSSVKGKLLVLLCLLHVYILCLPKRRAQSSCAVNACLKEAKQNRMGNVFQVSPSNALSCFYASGKVAVFYHTSLCASLCTLLDRLFLSSFLCASRNRCVIQRGCQLFTLHSVRGLTGCRGALGLKQTCDQTFGPSLKQVFCCCCCCCWAGQIKASH